MPPSRHTHLLEQLNARLILTGKTPPGVTVTAQGKPVSVGPDGRLPSRPTYKERACFSGCALRINKTKGAGRLPSSLSSAGHRGQAPEH